MRHLEMELNMYDIYVVHANVKCGTEAIGLLLLISYISNLKQIIDIWLKYRTWLSWNNVEWYNLRIYLWMGEPVSTYIR